MRSDGRRYCKRCCCWRTTDMFTGKQVTCDRCLDATSTCARCYESKPKTAFDLGPSGKRRYGVCRDCRRADAGRKKADRRAREDALKARMKTRTWTKAGVTWRSCSVCGHQGPLESDFYRVRRKKDGTPMHSYRCRSCDSKRTSEQRRWLVRVSEEERKRKNAANREWARRNPDKAREAHQKWLEKVKADPERYAHFLETRRMAYALRKMRQGKTISHRPGLRRGPEVKERFGSKSSPLVCWALGRALARIADDIPTPGDESFLAGLARQCGVAERTIYRWRHEVGHVEFDVADRVLTTLGMRWWEVWTPENCRRPIIVASIRSRSSESKGRRMMTQRRVGYGWSVPDPHAVELARWAFDPEPNEPRPEPPFELRPEPCHMDEQVLAEAA